jgi:hypothetical protein
VSGVDERDMTAAGRAWMRGELSSAEYFGMVRRGVRRDVVAPYWWRRVVGWWKR